MQSQWSAPNASLDQRQRAESSSAQSGVIELGARAETLLRRLHDVEEALTDQEWWLMGNVFPEARRLAEITSLLSVARGELETFLNEVCGMTVAAENERKGADEDVFALMGDPMWMSGSREKAFALLRMLVAQVPPMRQYATALQVNAERMRVPPAAMDPLGICAERLVEIEEMLRQPLS
ncbi:MAG TPA: hypothetical protein VFQ25_11060 [Ktedonobacterales bacterium]|nr:hypothetical protein [Ktedonobacterales bacterium]